MAQNLTVPGLHIPTRAERFATLKALVGEITHLSKVYVRRAKERADRLVAEPPAPRGYESFRDFQLYGIVDQAFLPGRWHAYLDLVDTLTRTRDQLLTYAARRVGDADDRYQNREEWLEWSSGEPLPPKRGAERELATRHFRNGKKHDLTLFLVAMNWMVLQGRHIDRRRAVLIKKSVDRAYVEVNGEKPPPVPRGWWHPRNDLGTTPGGLQMMGLAWHPVVDHEEDMRQTIVPYHQIIAATLKFTCWQDDAENWA